MNQYNLKNTRKTQKNSRFYRGNSLIEARREKIIVLAILCIAIFSFIPVVSALDWDNKLSYKNNDMTIEISNWLGIIGWLGFDDVIGEATLSSHRTVNEVRQVEVGKNVAVMWYEFNFDEEYSNGLGDVKFIDVNNGKEIEKNYYFAEAVYGNVEVDVWGQECKEIITVNGTEEVCEGKVVGTTTERKIVEWKKLDSNNIPSGEVTIGLITNVGLGETTDGIWKIAGKYASKHAFWTTDLTDITYAYYAFDEGAGTNAKELTKGIHNLTLTGNHWIDDGQINYAYEAYEDERAYTNQSSGGIWLENFSSEQISISFWARRNGSIHDGSLFDNRKVGDTGRLSVGRSNDSDLTFFVEHDTGTSSSAIHLGTTWEHYVMRVTPDVQEVYKNGVLTTNDTITSFDFNATMFPFTIFGNPSDDSKNIANVTLDELVFFNATLTDTQITNLYNSGSGVQYATFFTITSSLTAPEEGYNTSATDFEFEGSFTTNEYGNITNATLYLWDSSNTAYTNFTTLTGETNSTNLTISNLDIGNYNWNYFACGENTGGVAFCDWADSNRTFSRVLLTTRAISYNSTAFETTCAT